MNKLGSGGLLVAAIGLIVVGAFLRLDLIDWLIDAVGFLFIASGVVLGLVAIIRGLSGSKESSSTV